MGVKERASPEPVGVAAKIRPSQRVDLSVQDCSRDSELMRFSSEPKRAMGRASRGVVRSAHHLILFSAQALHGLYFGGAACRCENSERRHGKNQ